MKRLVTVTKTLLVDWVRNREAVFFALLFPLILLVVFSTVFAGGPTEFELAVQNNDITTEGEPTELSTELLEAMEKAGPLSVETIDRDVALSNTQNIEAQTGHTRILIIPDGFDEHVREQSARVRIAVIRDTVDLFQNDMSDSDQEAVRNGLETFEGEQSGGIETDPVQLRLLTVPGDNAAGAVKSILQSVVATFNQKAIGIEKPVVDLDAEERGQADLSATGYFLPAFIVAMILINGVMTVPSTVAEFRRDGTIKRLAATPLRKREWVLANVLQQSILAVVLALVLIGVAWVIFGVRVVPGPLALGLVLLGAIAFTALGMIVGGLIQDPGSAVSLGGAIALPLMFISGIFWELDLMPPALQTIAEFSPVTHYHRSLREVLILDSTTGVPKTAAMLAILAIVFLIGATWVTDWRAFD